MPAPPAAAFENLAKGALAAAQLQGERANDLAAAIGDTLAKSLAMLVSASSVLPGIAASAPPPALSGSTVGPGKLMATTGPQAAQVERPAQAALASVGLRGERIDDLARTLAQVIEAGAKLFLTQMMVAPGIAIVGGVTTSPGLLTGLPPTKGVLEPIALAALTQNKLHGEASRKLAGALAQVTSAALALLASSVSVAPGIASTPAATSGPGRLI